MLGNVKVCGKVRVYTGSNALVDTDTNMSL